MRERLDSDRSHENGARVSLTKQLDGYVNLELDGRDENTLHV